MIYALATRYLFDPLTWILCLLVASLIAAHYRRDALQRGLAAGAAVVLLGLMTLPIGASLARPLENRFPRPAPPAHVDGIVILSGGLNPGVFASRGVMGENWTTLRMVAGAALARRYPGAKLVFSGIASASPAGRKAERQAAETLLAALGIAPGRTLFEMTSRDTGENIANSMAMVHPKPGETWMLVTSAVHMPRAMAIARRLGWTMTPWPSDYISATSESSGIRIVYTADRLRDIDRALHEWIGAVVYALTGRA